jgi:hypothetical protein
VLLGAIIGTTLGFRKLAQQGVLKALGLAFIIAWFKLIDVY